MIKSVKKYQSDKGNKHSMFIAFITLIKVVVLSLFFISTSSAQDIVSVGVVNVTFLIENAPQAEVASSNLKDKFLPQELKLAKELEDINNLEIELKTFIAENTDDEIRRQKEREIRSRKRTRGRFLQDFREELRFSRDLALDVVQKEVFAAIDEVRKLKEIDIILQDYVSASKRVDITPVVLEFLKSKLEADTKKSEKK